MVRPICVYKETANNLIKQLNWVHDNQCDILIAPITNPNFFREFDGDYIKPKHLAFARTDLLLQPQRWRGNVIARLSDDIDCDSLNIDIRRQSELVLKQEIAFSQHLASSGYVMLKLRGTETLNLARTVMSSIKGKEIIEYVVCIAKITIKTFCV